MHIKLFFLTAPREKTENTRTRTDAHVHTYTEQTCGRAGGQAGRMAGTLLVHWAVVKGGLPTTPSLLVAAAAMVIAADWSGGGWGGRQRGEASSLGQAAVQPHGRAVAVLDVAVVEAVAGQGAAGGRDAAVLQQVETWGGRDSRGGAGAGGRVPLGERLHGGEDQGEAVGHVLVGSAGQGWSVACRGRQVRSAGHLMGSRQD